jgi:hypothetical protein
VLTAAQSPARYLFQGEVREVEGKRLLYNAVPMHGLSIANLEVLPNRDSLIYKNLYSLHDAHSVYRGTLRCARASPTPLLAPRAPRAPRSRRA